LSESMGRDGGALGSREEEEASDNANAQFPDPALEGGAREYAQRVFPANCFGAEATLRGRIVVEEHESSSGLEPRAVHLELTREHDLFFLFTHSLDRRDFDDFASAQNLTVSFAEYPGVLARMLSGPSRDSSRLAPHLKAPPNEPARKPQSATLEFVQDIEYKLVNLLSVQA